MLRLPIIDWN